MDEQREKRKTERIKLLKFILIFILILSGTILDRSNSFVKDTSEVFLDQQDMMREFMVLGWVLLAYHFIPYDNLKIKSFTFMFAIWAVIIILHNNFYDMQPNILSYTLYSCYLLWIARIALISIHYRLETVFEKKHLDKLDEAGVAYNILLPVKTFRGLLQILFIPWKNPLYETRLLVAGHKITGVKNKRFIQVAFDKEYITALTGRGYKVRFCKNYSKSKVDKLVGKKLILGFRDCRKLEL